MDSLSVAQARRIALHAQGFGSRRPAGRIGPARILRLAKQLGALQIDSVNVLVRAQYMPLFSRLGPYRLDLLDDLAYRRRELFEYWGHQASLLPTTFFPLMRRRMEHYRNSAGDPTYRGRFARWAAANSADVERVKKQVLERGPLAASDLSDPGERRGPWWGWPKGKAALEWLFAIGEVAVAARRNWERLYDLTERVIPAEILAEPEVTDEEAEDELVMLAARALGIATSDDIAFYFSTKPADTKRRVAALVSEGLLEETRVEGWRQAAYLPAGLRIPGPVWARALVSPFDSLLWERKRTERMFDFDYRIEIYTPAPQRRYGYYVLPFLLGERLVGRLDVKADRKAGVLLVPAVHLEAGVDASKVVPAMADELSLMAQWLGLGSVRVGRRGKAATELRRRVR